jgi:hypothetical protein
MGDGVRKMRYFSHRQHSGDLRQALLLFGTTCPETISVLNDTYLAQASSHVTLL